MNVPVLELHVRHVAFKWEGVSGLGRIEGDAAHYICNGFFIKHLFESGWKRYRLFIDHVVLKLINSIDSCYEHTTM